MEPERKVILYISMSLDGYIAGINDSLEFLSMVDEEGQDYGYHDFVDTTDSVIIGRKTFDKVLTMGFEYPHTDKDVYIISRTSRPDKGSFKYYTGSLKELILKLKDQRGKDIYCDGGAQIAHQMLKEDLIDELVISVIPIILGQGVSLFQSGLPELKLKLLRSKQYEKGLVQLHYTRERGSS
ncbi:MAG: dihydrofolate reductase family protein [Bacteroidales bacterium]|nr:dihydrofolate reductase family protein [Bacteroidales bacterium]MCF8404503.1 dihydrofolate reductase family protein [Bacteroidales bacterium]